MGVSALSDVLLLVGILMLLYMFLKLKMGLCTFTNQAQQDQATHTHVNHSRTKRDIRNRNSVPVDLWLLASHPEPQSASQVHLWFDFAENKFKFHSKNTKPLFFLNFFHENKIIFFQPD